MGKSVLKSSQEFIHFGCFGQKKEEIAMAGGPHIEHSANNPLLFVSMQI